VGAPHHSYGGAGRTVYTDDCNGDAALDVSRWIGRSSAQPAVIHPDPRRRRPNGPRASRGRNVGRVLGACWFSEPKYAFAVTVNAIDSAVEIKSNCHRVEGTRIYEPFVWRDRVSDSCGQMLRSEVIKVVVVACRLAHHCDHFINCLAEMDSVNADGRRFLSVAPKEKNPNHSQRQCRNQDSSLSDRRHASIYGRRHLERLMYPTEVIPPLTPISPSPHPRYPRSPVSR
jgi:hypothetical protein